MKTFMAQIFSFRVLLGIAASFSFYSNVALAEQGFGYALALESLSSRDGGRSFSIFPVHSLTLIDDSGVVSAGLLNAGKQNAARSAAEGEIEREVKEGKRQGLLQTKEYSYRESAPVAGVESRYSFVFGSTKSIFDGDFYIQSPQAVTDRIDLYGLEVVRGFGSWNFDYLSLGLSWDISARMYFLNEISGGRSQSHLAYTLNAPPALTLSSQIFPSLFLSGTGKIGFFGAYRYIKDSEKTSFPWALNAQMSYNLTEQWRAFFHIETIRDDFENNDSSSGKKISMTRAQIGIDFISK